jgi:outer membrane lipoprotein carrier protein
MEINSVSSFRKIPVQTVIQRLVALREVAGLLLVMFLVVVSSPAIAQDGQSAFKAFANSVQNIEAHFTQEQIDERGKVVAKSAGRMWLARPGKFRWLYEKPYEQLMVCDGQKIWLYDKDLEQVTVRSAKDALTGTPAALLAQKAVLDSAFRIEELGKQGKVSVVRLTPKNTAESDFRSIELSLMAGQPYRMRFFDQLGGSTDIRFSKISSGVGLRMDKSLFVFIPPKGVEVVDAR